MTRSQLARYARQILLPELGEAGQQRLLDARVLIVGAGGLGQEFRTAMSLQEYTDLSALFVIILVTVIIIDYASEKLRHRIIGLEARP